MFSVRHGPCCLGPSVTELSPWESLALPARQISSNLLQILWRRGIGKSPNSCQKLLTLWEGQEHLWRGQPGIPYLLLLHHQEGGLPVEEEAMPLWEGQEHLSKASRNPVADNPSFGPSLLYVCMTERSNQTEGKEGVLGKQQKVRA